MAEEFMFAVERTRFYREGGYEAMALVGDAGAALTVGIIGILHGGWRAGDEGVLAVVDGMGVGIGEPEIGAVRHAAVDGEGCAVVDAGGGALKFVDRTELGDGPPEWIDAGREWAGQRSGVLPGGEGIDRVVSALKDGAGGIKKGIVEGDRLRQVDVKRANQMFAVDVEIGSGDGGLAGDLALEREAALLHARGDEVSGEGGDVVGDALRESGGKTARDGNNRAADQRVGIGRKDLMAVIVGIIQKDLSVGDAVIGGDGGVVDLGNGDVEESVAGADDQRMRLAEGIGESGARAEVVGLEGNFAGGRE